ncbi:hypothetical protein K437DRAFT_271414 [Tilletiaria anomala UBC 951]|uniref:Uncharacterized protein n=1 Tax=Tilletiaria anomala (strain ATCC 24038 / CBS 436.72 / UBC 951) TaxID=1037660 RepID=A0A066UYY2_TILAU|nr:uncharacterized protein K437DRAFT_271414 [Tilletiaria anomala UBC 951]KDN34677.1 hypothetical protein K437DRAFT_271414 [Tilletiaria anomala UBC 951]
MSGQAAPAPTYAHLKEIVDNLRAELMAQRDPNAFEHKELVIPSSVDKDREIAVHIYEPENVKEGEKGPVVITLECCVVLAHRSAPWHSRSG